MLQQPLEVGVNIRSRHFCEIIDSRIPVNLTVQAQPTWLEARFDSKHILPDLAYFFLFPSLPTEPLNCCRVSSGDCSEELSRNQFGWLRFGAPSGEQ